MISQQLCGTNVIIFYSNTILVSRYNVSDSLKRKALWLSLGIGLSNFLSVHDSTVRCLSLIRSSFAWPAYRTIDRWGRRALVLLTVPFLAVTLLGAAFCFEIRGRKNESYNTKELAAVGTFLILFMIAYSPGLGPVPFTYSAEVFPLVNRGQSTCSVRVLKLTHRQKSVCLSRYLAIFLEPVSISCVPDSLH